MNQKAKTENEYLQYARTTLVPVEFGDHREIFPVETHYDSTPVNHSGDCSLREYAFIDRYTRRRLSTLLINVDEQSTGACVAVSSEYVQRDHAGRNGGEEKIMG